MGILTAVHAADTLAHDLVTTESSTSSNVDTTYLTELNVMGRLPAWQSACQQTIQEGDNLDG
jgi:hypothetical protein